MPVFGHHKAIRISNDNLLAYVEGRRTGTIGSRGAVKDATIRREINDIKAIFSYCAARDPALIPFSPVEKFKPPKEDNAKIIPPTEAEGRRIYQAARPHLRRFIQLAWFLGARPGPVEILSLTWGQVNWERRRVRIVSADKGGPPFRDVPVLPEVLTVFRTWYEEDKKELPQLLKWDKAHQKRKTATKFAPVPDEVSRVHVVHYFGHQIKTSIKTAWKNTLEKAGITRRIRPYDMRHHFATEVLEGGGDLKALSKVMGSAPKTLIQHYQHVTDALAEKTVKIIKPIDFEGDVSMPAAENPAPKIKGNVIDLARLMKKRSVNG